MRAPPKGRRGRGARDGCVEMHNLAGCHVLYGLHSRGWLWRMYVGLDQVLNLSQVMMMTLAGPCCCRRCRRSPHHAGCNRASARGGGTALADSKQGRNSRVTGRLLGTLDAGWRRVQEAFGSPKGVYHLGRLREILFRDLKDFTAHCDLGGGLLCSSVVEQSGYLSDVVQVLPGSIEVGGV